jgi:hypothetical protein
LPDGARGRDAEGVGITDQERKTMAQANGLTAKEQKHDEAEARAEAQRLRKKYAPKFKSVAPGIRTNSASKKFEVLVTKYVGSFDKLTAAKKARERFIAKVAKIA